MRIRRTTLAAALGILLIAYALAIVLLAKREPEVKVGFSFTGYTNSPRNALLAQFRVVNKGKGSIFRFGMYYLDTTQNPFDPTQPTNFFGLSPFWGRMIDAGQSETIAIPAVTNQGAWRAVFRFEHYGWRIRARDRLGPLRINSPS
jgi:hypothetical protein